MYICLYVNVHMSLCKVPKNIVRFQLNFNFLKRFPENMQISNLMKIRVVGAEVYNANGGSDGQMDRQTRRSL
jgi:hypothetical protein